MQTRTVIGIIAAVILAVFVYKAASKPVENSPLPSEAASEAEPATTTTDQSALALTNDDIIYGNRDAKVTILEYISLSCPHCAHFQNDVLAKLDGKYIATGKVRLVSRLFPHNEPGLRATQLVKCSDKKEYYPMIKAFLRAQEQWAFSEDYRPKLAKFAATLGFNPAEFDACLANKQVENTILKSMKEAEDKLKINAIPIVYVNDKRMENLTSVEEFVKVIDPLVAH